MKCVFERRGNSNICRCVRGGCKNWFKGDRCDGVEMECTGEGPSAVQQAVNLAKAAAAHVVAGRPRASEEEIRRRFAICVECELYKKVDDASGYCTHSKCGCNVKANVDDFLNKAAWEEQKCPHPSGDKWRTTNAT